MRLVCYAPNIAQLNMGLRVRHVGATGKVHHKEDTLYDDAQAWQDGMTVP